MKYSIVVTKVVKSTKTFEIEAEGLDAMYKNEDADEVRNLPTLRPSTMTFPMPKPPLSM